MTSQENPTPVPRGALALVFIVVFIDLLGFGIVLPLLPIFADTHVKSVIGPSASPVVSGIILGLLMSSFSVMQFLFAPGWGKLSDRVGRRPILLMGLAGSVLFYALFGYASDLENSALALTLLFVARIGAGVAGATISTAQAVIADCTPQEKRSRGMALIGAAFGIGFTFGPLIGFAALTLFPNHAGATGYFAAALSFLAFLLGWFRLPETRLVGAGFQPRKGFSLAGFGAVLSMKGIGPVILVFFLTTIGFSTFESTLALMNTDLLHLGKSTNFLLFAYVGLTLSLANGAYRPLSKRVSETAFMTLGMVLMGFGVASLGGITWLSRGLWTADQLLIPMMISLTVSVVGFAFLTPSAQGLISRRGDPERQGEILGVNQGCSALARILGPIAGLTLYKVDPMLPFIIGGALVLIMLPVMPKIRRG